MESRIAAYLSHRMPGADSVTVDELARIHGGSSQETFRLRAQWFEQGRAVERRLILRRAPDIPVLVKGDREVPYGKVVEAMVMLQDAGAAKLGFVTDPLPADPRKR